MPSKSDKTALTAAEQPDSGTNETSAVQSAQTGPSGPSGAPEINRSLLTAMQKERIKAEFELDDNPQKLKAAPSPAIADGPSDAELFRPARPVATPTPPRPTQSVPSTESPVDTHTKEEAAFTEPAKTDQSETEKADKSDRTPPVAKKRKRFWKRKAFWIPVILIAIIGWLAGVPYTRFHLAALFIKQSYTVMVSDVVTNKPVSSATVIIDGRSGMTDKDGKVRFDSIKPGDRQLRVSKKYYKDAEQQVVVPIYGDKGSRHIDLIATGRQVPVSVVNKLTGKAVADISVKAAGTEVKTDKDGKASIVLPADKTDLEVTVSGSGYNQQIARIKVTDQDVEQNHFGVVPAGRVYFLSGQSGKIDLVKTNLDGGDRQVVVYGTGKEDERNTVLLASRDWKYLAFYSKRDSGPAKLYLLDTSNDKLSVMDDSRSDVSLVGWSGHDFAFTSNRTGAKQWDAGRQAVKTYNAEKKQLLTVDQNQAEGDSANNKFQEFTNPYLVKDKLVYGVEWFSYSGSDLADRNDSIRMVPVGSQSKKDLRTFPAVQYNAFQANVYEPGGVYYAVWSVVDNKYSFFEYEDGQVKDVDIDQDKFFNTPYPTFLASPDGTKMFWSESRDGRETFFVGDKDAKNPKQVGVIDDGAVYGWYGNDYLLVSKKGSELFIMPVSGGESAKVSDYHKPQVSYRGYGGGYGGL